MSEQINRIELKGNVGSVRFSETATGRMARFSLATNYLFKNKDGEAGVETTWHNVVAWEGKYVQNIDRIVKGCSLHLTGRLRSTRYTGQDGNERQSYEVVVQKLAFSEDEPDN